MNRVLLGILIVTSRGKEKTQGIRKGVLIHILGHAYIELSEVTDQSIDSGIPSLKLSSG